MAEHDRVAYVADYIGLSATNDTMPSFTWAPSSPAISVAVLWLLLTLSDSTEVCEILSGQEWNIILDPETVIGDVYRSYIRIF
jgi:hypothetical protein